MAAAAAAVAASEEITEQEESADVSSGEDGNDGIDDKEDSVGSAAPPEQDDKDGVHAAGSEGISTETPVPQIALQHRRRQAGKRSGSTRNGTESGQTQRDANAQHKLKVAPKQDGGTLSDGHECLLFQEPVKFKVLALHGTPGS